MEKLCEPPVVLESKPSEISEEFESRRFIEENIIPALKHTNINTIGICEVGGVGKIRMATLIVEKVKEEKLFDFVMMVWVGASPDLQRIVYEISDYLGVRSEGGDFVATTKELFSKLDVEERILIILDEVQEVLDLKELGIPLQKLRGSCKILITSRFNSVCSAMGAQEIFTVTGLKKETVGMEKGKVAGKNKGSVFSKQRLRVSTMIGGHLAEQLKYKGTKEKDNLGKVLLKGVRVHNEMYPQSVSSTSKKATMTKGVDTDPPERFPLERGDERLAEDVSTHRTKATEARKEGISEEAKSIVYTIIGGNEEYMKDCILFCSAFPSDYKFTRDMLVCQWIAQGLIKLGEDEIMEEVYIQCFNTLLNLDYIVPCGYDHYFELTKYKVGDKMNAFLQKQRLEPKFRKDLDSTEMDVAKIEHLSLAFKEFDHIDFGILKQCSGLQTLMIYQCYGCKVKCLPSDLF